MSSAAGQSGASHNYVLGFHSAVDKAIAAIRRAIVTLGDRDGTSKVRIRRALGATSPGMGDLVSAALKRGAETRVFVRVGYKWKIWHPAIAGAEVAGRKSLNERQQADAQKAGVGEGHAPQCITIRAKLRVGDELHFRVKMTTKMSRLLSS